MKFFFLPILLTSLCLFTSAAQSEILIGVSLPLTGAVAEYGVAVKNGIELAQEEHSNLLKGVRFVFEDNRYDSATALTTFNKFRNRGDIALMMMWGHGPNQAIGPVSDNAKIPVIAVTAQRDVTKNRPYMIRFCYYGEQASHLLLQYFRKNGMKKIGIVKTELAFINSIIDGLQQGLKADERLELIDTYQLGDIDFRSSILKLQRKSFDTIGVFLAGGQVSQFYRQMGERNFSPVTFGTDFFDSREEVRQSGGQMEGAVFAAPFVDSGFIDRYRGKFGNDLQVPWAANAYEFAHLIGRRVESLQSPPHGEELLTLFQKPGIQKGVIGEYEYQQTENGAAFHMQVVTKKITRNGIEVIH